ncbi:MAG TPA: hypothetical protein VIL44_09230 [Micromonospora sp.]
MAPARAVFGEQDAAGVTVVPRSAVVGGELLVGLGVESVRVAVQPGGASASSPE